MPTSSSRKRLRVLIGSLAMLLALVAAAFVGVTDNINVPPRSLAPYVERRLSDHRPLLAQTGRWLARMLNELDRDETRISQRPLRIGTRLEAASAPVGATTHLVTVASPEQARQAIEHAQPGDVITFEPGTYRFLAGNIDAKQPGRPDAGITVRASRTGTVFIEMANQEGFVVSAPYWSFENLTIRGVCEQHSECEHAFHVVGGATHFSARNNTLIDFNAHIKANGQDRRFPDDGLIENNTISDTAPRQTESTVAAIDLVAVSHWMVRGNLITDFVKAGADRTSYGAYAKGGGSANRFERNAVLCEVLLRGAPGARVGLSLGGGGTGQEFCRDRACITEQDEGAIESNLVASCSDDGIYVNRGAASSIMHNTLIDTGGIVVRFTQSSAEVEGNLVDGAIRSRNGGLLHAGDNLQDGMTALYLGRHPQRALFRDAAALDLAWAAPPPLRKAASPPSEDLCGSMRPSVPVYGAFGDFAACLDALPGRAIGQ